MTKANKTNTTTSKAKKEEVPDEIRLAILAQLTDYKVDPVADEDLTKEINYVLAANGLFKVTKKPVAVYTEKVEDITVSLPGLPELEEGFRLLIPKIPGKYAIQLLSWYRDVYKKDGTECSVLFFWNHRNVDIPQFDALNRPLKGLTVDGQLIVYVPEQENSSTLSEFGDDEMVDWFRQNMALLLESHSHNSMDAFFSGTDDANEKMNQFYHVWGRVDQDIPAYVLRYVVGNTRKMVKLSDLFDIPQVEVKTTVKTDVHAKVVGDMDLVLSQNLEGSTSDTEVTTDLVEYAGPWPQVEYPEDWMGKHQKSRPITTARGGAYSYAKGKVWDSALRGYVWPEDKLPGYGADWRTQWDDYLDEREAAEAAGKSKEVIAANSTAVAYELEFSNPLDDEVSTRSSIVTCMTELIGNSHDKLILQHLLMNRKH